MLSHYNVSHGLMILAKKKLLLQVRMIVISQWFYFAYFTAEYRLLPNPKKACIFPIFDLISKSADFIRQ